MGVGLAFLDWINRFSVEVLRLDPANKDANAALERLRS
jgi:hypothetical protein